MKYFVVAALLLTSLTRPYAGEPDFQSRHLAIALSRSTPAFSSFSLDSLGQGRLSHNPVLAETNAVAGLEMEGQTYRLNGKIVWRI